MCEQNKLATWLEQEHKILDAYADTAKTYTQLSLGALALSITFYEKVLGQTSGGIRVTVFLLAAWLFWLATVIAASFYQYLAVKFCERRAEEYGLLQPRVPRLMFKNLIEHPWKVYAVMLICFYLGSICFVAVGIQQMLHRT
jgi:hypothetical protein